MQVVITNEFYTEEYLAGNSDYLFVFGDNTLRRGLGGQAVIRNCKNSIGLVTKRFPGIKDIDYFNDREFSKVAKLINDDIERILLAGVNYKAVVFPFGGLGTGLSRLPEEAPYIYAYLCQELEKNFGIKSSTDHTLFK